MPTSGNNTSHLSFTAQGGDMVVTAYQIRPSVALYDHASHRLDTDGVRALREECDKALAAAGPLFEETA